MAIRLLHSQGESWISGEWFVPPQSSAVKTLDHRDSTIAPAWIDSHCHIIPTGLDLLKLNLRGLATPQEVLDAVRDWDRDHPEGWLHAVQYDQTRFPGATHLTRHDLDKVVSNRPVLLRHSNGHASVANSAALQAAGITSTTPDPMGGEFVRDASGEPTGVLLERAHELVTSKSPDPTLEEMIEAVIRAGDLMASYGISSATDMMTGRWDLEKELLAYHVASQSGCKVRLRMMLQWATVLGSRAVPDQRLQELMNPMQEDRCRVIGLKIFADGAIGSATAAIHANYKTTGGQGQLIYPKEKLHQIIRDGHNAGWAIAVHTIGDRSTDLVMDGFEQTDDPSRHRLEHVMILSDSQIERIARSGIRVTLQPEFLSRFGHSYKAQLPDDVWPHLKRARSILDAGIPLALNTDRPIVPGVPREGIEAAVNRPEGFDPSENVTREEAIAGWTTGAALLNDDKDSMGSLEPGMLADFRLISASGEEQLWVDGQPAS